ncbi:transporter substrate-binding domain-containing protein [Duganella sp. FT3S]|uniref:Transporter substrate-binding domain-containing protein n=1 Tax=Rugamonas fusca TaxID=2758568 RepID=A0A7W2EG66_9BURK|nr:transporter substrate-binding domain-containing protein [Rugamonas fusca]MBA5605261.1 transporter substrate-binding domain-containing protein [Rugamonas fusca]
MGGTAARASRPPVRLRLAALMLALAVAAAGAAAAPPSLVVLVDTGTEMPMAAFRENQLVDGMHHDLGLALAAALGRQAVFLGLPRKRIGMALEQGQADLICMYIPAWLPGNFNWSQPFFPLREVVVTDTTVPRPAGLADLKGQTIATVLGYFHPELERLLGPGFVREDGPSSSANLRKMAVGRLHHVVTQQSMLDYHQKTGERLSVYPPLLVKSYQGQCAVSPRGQVSVEAINKAIGHLVKDGEVARITARYQ